MATLKANGGAVRFYVHPANGSRIAICENGRVLINPGGRNGWKRSAIRQEDLAKRGFVEARREAGQSSHSV